MIFFFYHNEFFRKLNKSVLDCREVERNSKTSILFQYWYMLHQGFDRELPLPQKLPHRTGPQYSTNLEVRKKNHSLALRFRIPLRPDQSRHATEITNKQSLNSELMNIPKFLDFSSQCLAGIHQLYILFQRLQLKRKMERLAGAVISILLKTGSPTWISQLWADVSLSEVSNARLFVWKVCLAFHSTWLPSRTTTINCYVNTSLPTSTTTQRNSSLATLFTTLASG